MYFAANSCGVISSSRWNSLSLSCHCQTKRPGGVPRWTQSIRWMTAINSAFVSRNADIVAPAACWSRSVFAPSRSFVRSMPFIVRVLDEL